LYHQTGYQLFLTVNKKQLSGCDKKRHSGNANKTIESDIPITTDKPQGLKLPL